MTNDPDQISKVGESLQRRLSSAIKNADLAFLDSAANRAASRLPYWSRQHSFRPMNANALRGLYRLSVEATQAINDARRCDASFIGHLDLRTLYFAETPVRPEYRHEIFRCFCSLQPGDEVCISIMGTTRTLFPWQQVCRATGCWLMSSPDKQGIITAEGNGQED